MICALLAYKYSEKLDIEAAFSFYGNRRTLDGKGVTIPSQIRFAQYFASIHTFKDGTWENEKDAHKELVSIHINSPPKTFAVWYVITTIVEGKTRTYESDREQIRKYKDLPKVIFATNYLINRETKISFYSEDSKAKPIFYFWFHTKFISDKLELDKRSLDKLNDKELYDQEFSIILNFDDVNPVDLPTKIQSMPVISSTKRVSTRKELVSNTFNSIRRVRNAPPASDDYKRMTVDSHDIKKVYNHSEPGNQESSPPSTTYYSPSITSPLLEEFIAQKSQLLLPALRDSVSDSTSESTSYSTDYSTESLGKNETDSTNREIPPEDDELLGGILKDIAIKNNVIDLN
jgi:hypothetical protein